MLASEISQTIQSCNPNVTSFPNSRTVFDKNWFENDQTLVLFVKFPETDLHSFLIVKVKSKNHWSSHIKTHLSLVIRCWKEEDRLRVQGVWATANSQSFSTPHLALSRPGWHACILWSNSCKSCLVSSTAAAAYCNTSWFLEILTGLTSFPFGGNSHSDCRWTPLQVLLLKGIQNCFSPIIKSIAVTTWSPGIQQSYKKIIPCSPLSQESRVLFSITMAALTQKYAGIMPGANFNSFK